MFALLVHRIVRSMWTDDLGKAVSCIIAAIGLVWFILAYGSGWTPRFDVALMLLAEEAWTISWFRRERIAWREARRRRLHAVPLRVLCTRNVSPN